MAGPASSSTTRARVPISVAMGASMRESSIAVLSRSGAPPTSASASTRRVWSVAIVSLPGRLRSVVPARGGMRGPAPFSEPAPRYARHRREYREIGGDVSLDRLDRLFEHVQAPADLARADTRRLAFELRHAVAVRQHLARRAGLHAQQIAQPQLMDLEHAPQ